MHSLLTAPLTTTYVSMQLAIKAHRSSHSLQAYRNDEELVRLIPKEIPTQDRARYEMLIRSGVIGRLLVHPIILTV